jgi:hypothetical protein
MSIGAISSSLAIQRSSALARGGEAAPPESGGDPASSSQTQAPGAYISPVLRYDQNARVAVLYFRDFDTGETRDQIPAKRVVEKYRQSGGRSSETETETSATTTRSAPATRDFTGAAPTTTPPAPTLPAAPSASTVATSPAATPTTGGTSGQAPAFSSVSISV